MHQCFIFAHGDSDGVSSAALAKAFLEKSGYEVSVVFTHPVGLLGDLREFYRGVGCAFIVDIAVSELHSEEIFKVLADMSSRDEVIYVDHHPLIEGPSVPKGVELVYDTHCSTSELTYKLLRERGLEPEYSRVALYGAIGNYLDETAWVKDEMGRWDKRSIYLEAGILIQGLEGSRRDHDFKRRVVAHLSDNKLPSALKELVERSLKQAAEDESLRVWVKGNATLKGKIGYVINPSGSLGKAANYARIYSGAKVGIAIEERKDVYVMSLRGEAGLDLNQILRKLGKKLGISGGGHPQAAGARVPVGIFYIFLDELNSAL
ncbi:MAG: DHHA1 domain-containing protein [Desulfurococcaceae archaeon]